MYLCRAWLGSAAGAATCAGDPGDAGFNPGLAPPLTLTETRFQYEHRNIRVQMWGKASPRVRGRPARNGLDADKMPALPGEV